MKMIGIIFSDVYGSELEELTRSRTVASMPFGGRYRQIDFALSNMVNSDIFNIGVITNQNYRSLVDHLGSCQEWDLNRKKGGVHILPTAMSEKVAKEHSGKLDELRAALFFLKQETAEYVLLSDTNIIFNIDYRDVLESHVKSGCDITVVAKKTVENEKRPHEITLEVNENGDCRSISINYPAKKGMFKGMGSFIMSREKLVEIIEEYTARGNYSFKRDYIQRPVSYTHLYNRSLTCAATHQ